jgi:hypothetical protein
MAAEGLRLLQRAQPRSGGFRPNNLELRPNLTSPCFSIASGTKRSYLSGAA